jgi:glycosyl transferase family 87
VVAAEALAVVAPHHHVHWRWTVALILVAGAGVLVLARRDDLTLRAVILAITAAVAVALVTPPSGSRDLWSYEMYGRMIAVHHANVFTHVPADFPTDPFLARLGAGWRHTSSIYGPAFLAVAATGARVAGPSALTARLWFQGLEAVALGGVLAVLWRRTSNPRVLAVVGLHPVVVLSFVNGGHNDLLVGLAVLVAVGAVERDRPAAAGLAMGLGALVKLTGLLGLVGIGVWQWRRRRRDALMTAAVTFVTIVVAHGGFMIGELHAFDDNRGRLSRSSPWQLGRIVLGLNGPLPRWSGLSRGDALSLMTTLGAVVVVILAVVVAVRRSRDVTSDGAAAGCLAAYGAAGPYSLPWYAGWWLPAGLLDPASRAAQFFSVWGTAMVATYATPHLFHVPLGSVPYVLLGYVLPIAVLGFFVWCVVLPRPVRGARRVE